MILIAVGLAMAGGLAGCTQFEPFQRQGTWHENDAPMQNIAIELADPHDLYRGRGDATMTGQMAVTAIDGSVAALSPGAGSGGASATTGAGGGSAGAGSGGAASSGAGGVTGGSGGSTGSIGSTGGGSM